MAELRPFQEQGAKWLASRSTALLADEQGVGKTAQAIRACDLVGAKRVLVIVPAVARINWQREFSKFSDVGRKFAVLLDGRRGWSPTDSVICSYDLLSKIEPVLLGRFDVLILDEVHLVKSPDALRSRLVWDRGGVVRLAERRWALSGTPAPNHIGELWLLLFTFGVTPLRYDDFVERFCNYYLGPHGRSITGTKQSRVPELRNMLSGVMLRRMKEDVMKELPPITYEDIVVEPGAVDLELQSSFIQYVFPVDRRKELEAQLASEKSLVEATISAARLGRDGLMALEAISQSVSTLRRFTGLQKVQPTIELVKAELESNAYEKLVIFAVHRDVIEGLRVGLSKFGAVTLYGGTNPKTRQDNIDRFQTNPKCRVFIGNIAAAGTAINLTAAHNELFVEQDWVPGNNAQAAMRCHRYGQTKSVHVRFIGLADTIDEKIAQVLKRKTRELNAIFNVQDENELQLAKRDDNSASFTDNSKGETT